jgi:hypothetical protein
MANPLLSTTETFRHVRIVIGMILGLSITRLLNGLVRIIQHPKEETRIYSVHIGWVIYLLFTLVHFWWWELFLIELPSWQFQTYLFLIVYVIVLFFLSAFLFPESLSEYRGYEDFFISRRKWFFGFFALMMIFDLIDTLIKGRTHLVMLGTEYTIRLVAYLILCGIAFYTTNRKFHKVFVAAALAYNISWIFRYYSTLR